MIGENLRAKKLQSDPCSAADNSDEGRKSTIITACFHTKKWPYYGRMLLRLVMALRNPFAVLQVIMGRPATLHFKSGFSLYVLSPLDLLVAAEVILLDCYRLRDVYSPRIVIDVGGALGEFGLFAAHLFRSAQVTIFEPSPESFTILQRNAALNQLDNATLRMACIGPESTYEFPVSHSGQNSLLGNDTDRVEVPGVRLQDTIDQVVDVLKVDTEGFEVPVLKSAGSRLEHVRRVFLEYHEHVVPGQRKELEELLRAAGFTVTTVPDPFNPTIGLIFAINQHIA